MGDKPFYWRVLALDGAGNPIGGYSDALPFELDPAAEQGVVAIFGDSISHGGGSISYSPTDWDFSYASYLMFPTINLAQSGDTSAMGVERFDAMSCLSSRRMSSSSSDPTASGWRAGRRSHC